jgi:hypothetical protein
MRWLNKKRASGKTTGLIFASEATGYPIIVETDIQAKTVKDNAAKLGVKIPEPMSVKKFFDTSQGRHYEKILIDESPRIIEEALKKYFNGIEISAVTMSLDDIQ